MAPFGSPVVPEVYTDATSSPQALRALGCCAIALHELAQIRVRSQAAHAPPPEKTVHSRRTRIQKIEWRKVVITVLDSRGTHRGVRNVGVKILLGNQNAPSYPSPTES